MAISVYIGLFFTAFGAATVIPLSSEIVFLSLILSGYDPVTIIVVASLGNCLGVTFNYILGYYGLNKFIRYFGYSRKIHNWIYKKTQKYHLFIYIFGWAPIIGDPITIYAGISKLKFSYFAIIIYGGRIIRYILIYSFLN